jgi:hypothetical protein
MKRTLLQIAETITQKANEMRTDAAYTGEHGDGGASKLEQNLEFFVLGFKTQTGNMGILGLETKVDVPYAWQKYFFRQDPEYDEYLRLKNKFENK